jgi:lysylphosphatidylglycerol synthetase-like protein (DUF2156 family)
VTTRLDPLRPSPPMPTAVVAYAALVAGIVLFFLIARWPQDPGAVGGEALLLIATTCVLARLWLAWIFLVFVAAGDIVVAFGNGPDWWAAILNGVMLALLLLPSTRRYARRGRPPLWRHAR